MVDKNCISTINNKRFDPTMPTDENIEIDDIAHALSMITRANGHFYEFYSVARHCINCVYEARARGYSVRVQLFCLLHDSAEAYIGDMTRPLKLKIPFFNELEKKYQYIIFKKYADIDISQDEIDKVKAVDDCFLYHEFIIFNGERLLDEEPPINVDVKNSIKPIAQTEKEFLDLYNELSVK